MARRAWRVWALCLRASSCRAGRWTDRSAATPISALPLHAAPADCKELKALWKAGFEVAAHGVNHKRLAGAARRFVQSEVADNRKQLAACGLHRRDIQGFRGARRAALRRRRLSCCGCRTCRVAVHRTCRVAVHCTQPTPRCRPFHPASPGQRLTWTWTPSCEACWPPTASCTTRRCWRRRRALGRACGPGTWAAAFPTTAKGGGHQGVAGGGPIDVSYGWPRPAAVRSSREPSSHPVPACRSVTGDFGTHNQTCEPGERWEGLWQVPSECRKLIARP